MPFGDVNVLLAVAHILFNRRDVLTEIMHSPISIYQRISSYTVSKQPARALLQPQHFRDFARLTPSKELRLIELAIEEREISNMPL